MMVAMELVITIIHGTAETAMGLAIAGNGKTHKTTVKEGQNPGMETAPGYQE